MNDIKIKKLTVADWQDYKAARLMALKNASHLFAQTFEDAAVKDQAYWQEPLSQQKHAIFCLYKGHDIIGLTGVFTWREDPKEETAIFAMSFVLPEYRGKGLSKLFYEARIGWCLMQPHLKINVGHREGNEASKRAILRHGFTLVSKTMNTWPDGGEDYRYEYELDLVALRRQKGIELQHG